ncbi:hypothetical protein COCOBI_04-5710 [Coccomyxa sp. Obi]|nr:hypothetical protein COCOBI_04-5710 [Coccomyxa sp. Obi]
MSSGFEQSGLQEQAADNKNRLLPPGSGPDEQYQADWRKVNGLPELRKRFSSEAKAISDREHPLNKKAEQMGFRQVDLMHPHLLKGKEVPRDLEDWGKRMLMWVRLSVKISALEELKKELEAQARRRASKSPARSGMWSDFRALGKNTWGSFFS